MNWSIKLIDDPIFINTFSVLCETVTFALNLNPQDRKLKTGYTSFLFQNTADVMYSWTM